MSKMNWGKHKKYASLEPKRQTAMALSLKEEKRASKAQISLLIKLGLDKQLSPEMRQKLTMKHCSILISKEFEKRRRNSDEIRSQEKHVKLILNEENP